MATLPVEVSVKTTTVSSREFNQDVSGVKRASTNGPVFITHRGKPAHVLLTIEEYDRLRDATGAKKNILEMLAMPGIGSIDFDPPRFSGNSLKVPDFGE